VTVDELTSEQVCCVGWQVNWVQVCCVDGQVSWARLAALQRCYEHRLRELNARLSRQAAEREMLDERRDACQQQLQHDACLVRNHLQARFTQQQLADPYRREA